MVDIHNLSPEVEYHSLGAHLSYSSWTLDSEVHEDVVLIHLLYLLNRSQLELLQTMSHPCHVCVDLGQVMVHATWRVHSLGNLRLTTAKDVDIP